jgi:hypothetical protein
MRPCILLVSLALLSPACGGSSSETPWPVEPEGPALDPAGESAPPATPVDTPETPEDQGTPPEDEATPPEPAPERRR